MAVAANGAGAEDDSATEDASIIDEFGVSIGGAMGWPPMAGRAAGVLMLSGEPLTLAELQTALGASKGSVSETTRLLITNGTVERFKAPGSRHFVYRWRDDAWVGCLRHQLDQTNQLLDLSRTIADRAGAMADEQRRRIDDMRGYYTFMARRLEGLLREYTSASGEDAAHPTAGA